MKKLLKKPVFLAVSIAIASLIISYIGNQLPALKDLLQAKNSQDVAKILAENEIAIAAFIKTSPTRKSNCPSPIGCPL